MKKKIVSILLAGMLSVLSPLCASAMVQNGCDGTIDFQVSDRSFIFKGYEISEDYEGNPALLLFFDYTNNSSNASSASSDFYIQVFQDGISQNIAFLPYQSEFSTEYNNSMTDIRDGASLSTCSCFSIQNTTSPVDIEIKEFVNFSDELQSFTIDLSQYSSDSANDSLSSQDSQDNSSIDWEQKYNDLLSDYNSLKDEYEAYKSTHESSEAPLSSETENVIGSDVSGSSYADMLRTYSDIFTSNLEVFSNQKISQLISDGSSSEEILDEVSSVLSQIETSQSVLQNYYDDFNSNRTEPPMGTPIMRLLSDAQSALQQFSIALDHLQSYLTTSSQSDMDDFLKYMGKASDSLDSYNATLQSELDSLQE